jgi:ABC-2 type transport system permease protein
MNRRAMTAIFKRDFLAYFGNPTGYVFIVSFVFFMGVFAFAYPKGTFFAENKATLDGLSQWMPLLLLVFVPTITMSAWASEYRQGTEQLLLTLPAQDPELVLAKYGACLATYTVALGFGLCLVVVLECISSPDLGLMAATFLGYWLLGAALISLSMLASSFTKNQTLAFIVGALLCAVLVAIQYASPLLDALGAVGEAIAQLGAVRRFESFTRGVVALEDVLYFVAVAATALFANTIVLARRHWARGAGGALHGGVRLASVAVGGLSLVLFVQQAAVRADVTATKLLALTPEARKVIEGLDEKRPVTIEAWISPKVPDDYVAHRDALLRMLEEFDARGGDKLRVIVHETELYSEEAERAEALFKIKPEPVSFDENGHHTTADLFLGLVFRCGTREVTIPFFDRGLPIQYELTRGIGAAANVARSKVGVLTSGLNMFGGFDFASMNRSQQWQVVDDLKKQYEVSEVQGTAPIDTSLDVLVVPMPTALPQDQLDKVGDYIHQGGHVLLLVDSFPLSDMEKAPMRPPGAGRNPFQQNQAPPVQPGDLEPLLHAIGVSFPKDQVVWDADNPHPGFDFPKEVVFVLPKGETRESGFNEEDPITSGLQELAMIFPGRLEAADTPDVKATPLLTTGPRSGTHRWDEMVQESFFGLQQLPPDTRSYKADGQTRTLALKVTGKMRALTDGPTWKKGDPGKEFQAIVVSDIDLISDSFYDLRRQGGSDKTLPNLDNITFVANCIDALAGEDAYLTLRKLRPKNRTLTYFEALDARLAKQEAEAVQTAKDQSKSELDAAKDRLNKALDELKGRTDLDRRTQAIMLQAATDRENRRLETEKQRIDDREKAATRKSKSEVKRQRDAAQRQVLNLALLLPPILPLLIGLAVFVRKVQREREGTPAQRRRVA